MAAPVAAATPPATHRTASVLDNEDTTSPTRTQTVQPTPTPTYTNQGQAIQGRRGVLVGPG